MPNKTKIRQFLFTLFVCFLTLGCGPSEQQKANDRTIINDAIIRFGTELEVAQSNLQNIEQFHLLRTPAQKQQEITQQTQLINSIKMKISSLNEVLQRINNGDDYKIYAWQLK